MTEPTTQAGRALLADVDEHSLGKVKAWHYTLDGMSVRISRIEAEARGALGRELDILRADAADPARQTMWRYGVRHSLTIIERVLADPAAAAEEWVPRKQLDDLIAEYGQAREEMRAERNRFYASGQYLDLASPEAERRIAEAFAAAGLSPRLDAFRAVLAALREQP